MSDVRRPDVPGVDADKPTEIPAAGWWQVIRRAWAEAKADQVPLLAAGVAFFGFLSLFPAVVAAVLAYGLVADPSQIRFTYRLGPARDAPLWLTAYAVLLGAETNAETEQQTARDTTKGNPRPLGQRNAVKADSIPGSRADPGRS
ncbi:hypothetical protein AB0E63_30705 [Kribbella sp. NPDC026596]|uniref:hypothetical protein n=1 Tax=Kribbella sp. NPDC026596 TaxID=3155122 RepID=UPI0033D2BEEE